MNWVDIVIVVILAIGLFKGFGNGLVRGIFGLAAVGLGLLVAASNYEQVSEVLFSKLRAAPHWQDILAFLVIFVVALIIVNVLGNVISKALKLASLGWFDRVAGGLLGLVMACLFSGMVLLLVVMAGFHTNTGVTKSTVAPSVINVMDTVIGFAPEPAREMIEEHYVELRLQWEKARREAPKEEEGEGEGESEGQSEEVSSALPDPAALAAVLRTSPSAGVTARGA